MQITFDVNAAKDALVKRQSGIEKYVAIMNTLHNCDVSQDKTFQRMYNGFYRIRQRKQEFYQVYYTYMEKSKKASITFEDVIAFLYQSTSRVEPSFSSKLLATIHPDMPVWDANVLSQLSIKRPQWGQKDKSKQLSESVKTYAALRQWYTDYINTDNAKALILAFDALYPYAQITDVKKIDLALWSMGERK